MSFVAALLVGALLTVAYLWAFHSEVTAKEIGSTAFAIALGVVAGRVWERRAARG